MSGGDDWADIYDYVYSSVREDIPFYVDAALRHGPPVLELGCGTGRVTIPIGAAGVDIVGLDSSADMLDAAADKLAKGQTGADKVEFLQADMTDFSLGREFGLVILPFRGFQSLLTVEDQLRALDNIRKHLKPGGHLAFNIFVPDPESLVQEPDVPYHLRDATDPDTGRTLVLWQQGRYDHHDQIVDTRLIAEELGDGGEVVRKLYRDFRLRFTYRWEMHHLLTASGFEVEELSGDFEGSPFDEDSTEMVWLAAMSS